MSTDGNKAFYSDLADKNLDEAAVAKDALRIIKRNLARHTRADIDREERAAKDALTRAADAIRVLQDVGD